MNHYYQTIQGWFNFQNIYRQMVNIFPDGSLFVEIGSWKGTSSVFMGVELFNASKFNTQFICIDTWAENDDGEYINESSVINNTLFDEFINNITPLKDAGVKISQIKGKSENSVVNFKDESIDFLYIDGSHLYENVKKDIELYYPKMKNNSILAGHDWQSDDIKRAVLEFFDISMIKLDQNTWSINIDK